MKVLYIDHVENDFLSAIVYLGLCEELGASSIIDWPWKPTFHGQIYDGPVPYPPPLDRKIEEPFHWLSPQSARAWSDDEVAERIREFDLVVLASPRAYNAQALTQLIERVGRDRLPRLVQMDGEDYTAVRWDYVERFRPHVYFKTSMVKRPYEVYLAEKERTSGQTRVVSFPLASAIRAAPALPKTLDVVFLGGGNWHPGRQEGVPLTQPCQKPFLEARLAQEFPGFIGGYLPYEECIATLCRARIAVCVGGHGVTALRAYEILSCPGTLLARERNDHVVPHPMVDGVHEVSFDGGDFDDIVRVLRKYLQDEPARARIAAAGNALQLQHYTPRARARQLLDEALR
jgi:hypothetical protein